MKQPIKMTPGDDTHLSLLMAPQGLNLDVGEMREQLLAYGRAAFEAGKAGQCLHQIQEPEADIWPCVNIDVDASGKITNAKLYSPGLPAGNHDVYPVRVPYMDEHTEAWRACVDELEKAVPGFMSLGNMNGIECAVAAIRGLSERAKHQELAAAEQAAWHAGLDEGWAQAAPAAVAVPDERAAFEIWWSTPHLWSHGHKEAQWAAWQARAALAATPAALERTCGVCGADEAFTGTCGGGRANPTALCFEGAVATAIPAAAAPSLISSLESILADADVGPPTDSQWCCKECGRWTPWHHPEAHDHEEGCTAPREYAKRRDWKSRLSTLIAATPEAATATGLPAQAVPAFCHVAFLKLKSLQERGYQITGYALEKPVEGAQPERGFINHGGFVGWWWDGQSPQAQADTQDAVLAHLDGLLDDAAAHIYPSDLNKFQTGEHTATVASVRMGNSSERSVPLYSREQVVETFNAAQAAQGSEHG